jgi:hypothetical protein
VAWCLVKQMSNLTFTLLEVKWPGREADHLPPSSAEVKNVWNYT